MCQGVDDGKVALGETPTEKKRQFDIARGTKDTPHYQYKDKQQLLIH